MFWNHSRYFHQFFFSNFLWWSALYNKWPLTCQTKMDILHCPNSWIFLDIFGNYFKLQFYSYEWLLFLFCNVPWSNLHLFKKWPWLPRSNMTALGYWKNFKEPFFLFTRDHSFPELTDFPTQQVIIPSGKCCKKLVDSFLSVHYSI